MGLRSRKPGGQERAAARSDAEQQFVERADRPLQTLHVQTEAFNMMWRDFLFKLSCSLVLFAAYAAYTHKDNMDLAIFDGMGALYYAVSAAWLHGQESSFENYMSNPLFRLSMVPLLSQVGFFVFALVEGKADAEFVPVSLFYLVVVIFALRYMRGNAKRIRDSREELLELKNPAPGYRADSASEAVKAD
ncbi:Hypothetical Protein FCC1311_088892 [Hondaea fermentalgiana]|uniref:Uncharacterized protein n=1 Tax=Hondaea fermentalgiana TaxID=2315210 RepID=A0A2R5GXH7_9STRA|nr:Hypothetical Protein FCC1311_088892 [Hondaea fermentalgiana]|eukprot:GBG32664.1 Hypothetical Protein FCC1311_088892 [Hondaea fermentalgiana]